ncbi:c-type cytochrome [Cobetia sp. L2A1]|uniref:c-type cytochrome n=1 Tax=Cobetia sp. L2A1 TaxID=2686360 RepID=UPI00131C2FBB|nr:cytochrome c [Cobetia sp. L2A1]
MGQPGRNAVNDESIAKKRLMVRPAHRHLGSAIRLAAFAGVSTLLLSGCGNGEDEHAKQVAADKAATSDPALVKQGLYMAQASDCAACHTTKDGEDYAGGLPFETPVGEIFSTNITPDTEHGIGNYTLEEYTRVLREGEAADGHNLYPAMPFPSYARLTDDDIKALYAWNMHDVTPSSEPNRESEIPFPLNMRWPMGLWEEIFSPLEPWQDDEQKEADWNRGAYLVQGPGHCGSCHTERGLAFQEKALTGDEEGYLGGAMIEGWRAFNLTPDVKDGLGSWSEQDIVTYLSTGNLKGKAQAGGPMADVISHSMRHMTDEDLNAMAVYLKSLPALNGKGEQGEAVNDDDRKAEATAPSEKQADEKGSQDAPQVATRFNQGAPADDVLLLRGQPLDKRPDDKELIGQLTDATPGVRLYLGHCAMCHGADGAGTQDGYYPSLFHNSVTGSVYPDNLAQAILNGVQRESNGHSVFMPAFDSSLNDNELINLMDYLENRFGEGHDSQTLAAPDARRQLLSDKLKDWRGE